MWTALLTTTIAGLATVIGGLCVILVRGNLKPTLFAASLSFAAGVMLLISFVEVYVEGAAYITVAMGGGEDEHEHEHASSYSESNIAEGHMHEGGAPFLVAMVLFLSGWLLSCVLHGLLHWLTSDSHASTPDVRLGECLKCTSEHHGFPFVPAGDLSPPPMSIEIIETEIEMKHSTWMTRLIDSRVLTWFTGGRRQSAEENLTLKKMFVKDQSTFIHLGYFTALALTLHNIPEGMATFAAATNSSRFGVGLAFAIGIHNIPEGLAVSLPIYLGTGSMKKALLWTLVSALAEPLGGCITIGILTKPSPWIYGVLFLLTAGIMFNITLKELLPTANKYDPTNRVTSLFLFLGMIVMAAGLSIINIV